MPATHSGILSRFGSWDQKWAQATRRVRQPGKPLFGIWVDLPPARDQSAQGRAAGGAAWPALRPALVPHQRPSCRLPGCDGSSGVDAGLRFRFPGRRSSESPLVEVRPGGLDPPHRVHPSASGKPSPGALPTRRASTGDDPRAIQVLWEPDETWRSVEVSLGPDASRSASEGPQGGRFLVPGPRFAA